MPLKPHPPGTFGPYWTIRGTVGGRRFSRSTKTTVKSRAESLRIKWEAELEDRRIHGLNATASFAEAVIWYLDDGGDERFLRALVDHFGDRRLADIGQADLDDAARALYPNAAAATWNRQVHTPFIALYNLAVAKDAAPPRKWRRPRGHDRQPVIRWLWPAEVEACIRAAPPHGRTALELFVGAGFREQEGVGLEWADVRLVGDQGEAWTLKTKTDAPRRVDLFPRTVAALRAAQEVNGDRGRVLVNGGGGDFVLQPDGGGALRTLLNTIAKDAGVDPFGAHILRHTWATWRYACTMDPLDLKAAGGWKSLPMVERYVHLAPRTLAGELTAYGWDARLFSETDRVKNWSETTSDQKGSVVSMR